MKKAELLIELVATYQKHGWELKGALMRPDTRRELSVHEAVMLESLDIKEDILDALWFSRPSHQGREAWELRLLSETQYALFENFEVDETEEQRIEMRQEMEARLKEHVIGH